jgi:predicted permease
MSINDLKYAWRNLLRNRTVTFVVVISLAAAIGPNAALYGLLDQFFLSGGLRHAPESLVQIMMSRNATNRNLSYREYQALRRDSTLFSEIGAVSREGGVLYSEGVRENLAAEMVSTNYFSLLGVKAALGRQFQTVDNSIQDSVPIIISHALWQRRFSGSADIIGKSLVFRGHHATVVGIAERGFRGYGMVATIDIWVPMERWRNPLLPTDMPGLDVFSLLRTGVTLPQAKLEMRSISKDLSRIYPETNRGYQMNCYFARADSMRSRYVISSSILFLSAMVLAVACINVCTLLLARATGRQRETAIRIAVGAGRRHIFRLLLAEGLLLSVMAAALSIIFTRLLLMAAPSLIPTAATGLSWKLDLNLNVLIYTSLLAIFTTILFALAPAKQTYQFSVVHSLKTGAEGYRGKGRLSSFALLVIVQIALSQALLSGAALLLRSYHQVQQVRLGFDSNRPLLLVNLGPQRFGKESRVVNYGELVEKVAAIPGVKRATYADDLPLSDHDGFKYKIAKDPASGGQDLYEDVSAVGVGPNYFEIMGTTLLYGDGFERQGAQKEVVINRYLAERAFPKLANPAEVIGRFLRTKDQGDLRIIGIAEDGKYGTIRESKQPYLYVRAPESSGASTMLLVETAERRPENLAVKLRQFLSSAESGLVVYTIVPLKEHMRLARFGDELIAWLIGGLGLLSLFLSMVGLGGLAQYWVRRHNREIGIRLAMGATSWGVIRHMEIRALRPVLVGVLLGTAIAIIFERVISNVIFGVAAFDFTSFAASALFTFSVAIVATLIPTSQSGWINPNSILRQE